MARAFNGTNQSLRSTAALTNLASKTRLAIGFWIYTTFAADDDILLETSANSNSNPGSLKVLANESGTNRLWTDVVGNVGQASGDCAPPADNTWHHVLINYNLANAGATEVESIYINGTSQTLTHIATSNNTGSFTSQFLNVMSRNNASLYADGRMADLAIWAPTTAVAGTDVTNLAAGRRAHTVRNSELLYHWPLGGTASPEPANIGSTALTVNGATNVADPPTLDAMGGGGQTVALTSAAETDAAQSLPRIKARTIGAAVESDTGQPLPRARVRVVGPAAEADAAQPLARRKARTAGPAVGADTGQSLVRRKVRGISPGVETSTGQLLRPAHARTPGPAPETASGQPLGRRKTRALGAAGEADTASSLASTTTKGGPLTPAPETDTAQVLGRRKTKSPTPATEADAPQVLARTKRRTPTPSAETDTAQPVVRRKSRPLGAAVETDTARQLLPAGKISAATETDQAPPVRRVKVRSIAAATETDTSRPTARVRARVLTPVVELDQAVGVVRRKTRAVAASIETDESRPLPGVLVDTTTPKFTGTGTPTRPWAGRPRPRDWAGTTATRRWRTP